MDRSSKPSPTTVKPITPPDENATRSPLFKLWLAAYAVRALEDVAMLIPINPDIPEKNPPVIKANGTKGLTCFRKERTSSTTNIAAKKMLMPVYWRFK